MRLLKMLGLAAIAALAAMAFVGASSAAANETALCEENVLECPEEKQYKAGTTVLTSLLENALLLSTLVDVTCLVSHGKGKITGAGGKAGASLGNPLEGTIESLTFTSCHNSCIVTVSELGTLLLLKTAPNLGEAVVHGVLANVNCGVGIIDCNFVGGLLKLHALGTNGPTPAMLSASKVPLEIDPKNKGVLCPTSAEWDAAYEVLAPKPAYISL